MQTYRGSVKTELERLESEELAERVRSGGLTDVALSVAVDVLRARGVELPPVDSGAATAIQLGPFTVRAYRFVLRCWAGQESLLAAYWILGALLLGVEVLLLVLYSALSGPAGSFMGEVMSGALLLGLILGVLIHGVAVWRCAKNACVYAFGQLARVYACLQLGLWVVFVPIAMVVELFIGKYRPWRAEQKHSTCPRLSPSALKFSLKASVHAACSPFARFCIGSRSQRPRIRSLR